MRAIFIDRDGVLLKEPLFDPAVGPASEVIDSWKKFKILSGVDRAFVKLKGKDYRLFVVTNQDGIDEGSLPISLYNAMNDRLFKFINEHDGQPIDRIYTCPHPVAGTCKCRKPKRGLVDQALRDYPDVDLSQAWLVGDRPSDMKLGKSVGVRTIFIKTAHLPSGDAEPIADAVAGNLEEAVDYILREDHE